MNLHEDATAFNELAAIASQAIGIPTSAVKRDYFMVIMLQNSLKAPMQRTPFSRAAPLSVNAIPVPSVVSRKILT